MVAVRQPGGSLGRDVRLMTVAGRDSRGPATLRLTFRYEDGGIRLVGRQRVAKLALPSDSVTGYDGQQGFWVELRTPDGRTVYRRVMEDPFSDQLEIFFPDPERPIVRRQRQDRSGTFIVEVPEAEEVDRLLLFSSAGPGARAAGEAGPAIEVARVALGEGRFPRRETAQGGSF
jgi:hypothetical protein